VTPRGLYSYRPERRSGLDRILNMNKLDLVFYMLLAIIGTSLAAVSMVWVIHQTKAIWGL
jgi:cell division protein FtsL